MPHTLTKTVFYFGELNDRAKEAARDWFREHALDHDWYSSVYDDAAECAKILGIEIGPKNQRCILTGPNPREWIDNSPAIYFSGFASQGDGACFEGAYEYAKGAAKKIRQHAPKDSELHAIADELQALQRPALYRLGARMKHSGHYYHSGCMTVDTFHTVTSDELDAATDKALTELMRRFADWTYKQLNCEYDWQMADEQIDDSIKANEYEFTESGKRAC